MSGKIGGDANLSPRGEAYARELPRLVKESGVPPGTKLIVWTSTLKRTGQTAQHLVSEMNYDKLEWKALDELDSGVCDGLTYEQIAERYPDDFRARDDDKYNYRYRCGESYRDVVTRLEPIIMELERSENVMIVTHQAVLRCIYAYFLNMSQEASPWMEVPLHTLIKLTPRAYGTEETRIKANIPAVSTWRAKGTEARHQTTPSSALGPTTTDRIETTFLENKDETSSQRPKVQSSRVEMVEAPVPLEVIKPADQSVSTVNESAIDDSDEPPVEAPATVPAVGVTN